MTSARVPSVLDSVALPAQLVARVVAPGSRPLLHGYDVQDDLARHYSFAEVMLTAMTGEAPGERAGRAFEVAVIFASAIGIGEAPAHATMLARLCGARPSGVLSVGGITLAEQARFVVQGWLDGEPPSDCQPRDAEEAAAVDRLRAALRARDAYPTVLDAPLGLLPAILAVWQFAGLRQSWQLEAALCIARWAAVSAEAMAATPGDLKSYPMCLPAFEYAPEAE